MAATKLTLRLEEEIIRRGKLYAKTQGTSLSKLVEQILRDLLAQESDAAYEYVVEPDPFVQTIGIQEPTWAMDHDPREDRSAYYTAARRPV